jgi:hypothetical protein
MAKVWNDSRFTLTCTQINKKIKGHHFITVSDEAAKRVPLNGIFRVEYETTTTKRAAKKDAALEDQGSNPLDPGHTTWFAGGPKAKNEDG